MKKNHLQKVGLLILFTLCLVAITTAQKKRIGILGSSTSACFGFVGGKTGTECYAARIDNYYTNILQVTDMCRNNALSACNVYQAMPTSGYATPDGRPLPYAPVSITSMLEDPYWPVNTIIINFPSNGYDIYTVDEVMACFRQLKQIANAAGKICFITTTQPRHDGTFSTQASRDKLIQLKDQILIEFQNYAIDFWTGIANTDGTIKPEYDQGDHIHLNAAAHDILYSRVLARNVLLDPALPLYNLNFKAEYKNEKVIVSWKNDPDNQIESFQLQKSRDGRSFSPVYDIKTNASNAYSYTDQKPEEGNNFYRLLASFKSGKKDYSQVLKQSIRNGSFNIDKVFRSSRGIQIEWQSKIQQNYSLRLFNSAGSLVGSSEYRAATGSNRFTLLLPAIAKGSYFMVVENKMGEREVWPLMIPN